MGDVLDQVLERNDEVIRRFLFSKTVIVVVDGNEPDAEKREYLFDILARVQIISTKTAEIFYNYTVRPARFHIFDHLLKAGSFKSRATETVVNPYRILPKLGML